MSQEKTHVAIGRASAGAIAGAFGIMALVGAVISLAWQQRISVIVISLLVLGLIGLVGWAVIAPREFIDFFTGRQARNSTGSFIATLLLLGILTLIYIITARLNFGLDTTLGRSFSLSETTFEVVDRIPDDRIIQITGFYTSSALTLRAADAQFFNLYQQQTDGKVVVEYIDPNEQPGIAQNFGVQRDGDVFVSFLRPDGTIDFNATLPVPRAGRQERDVTIAIQQLLVDQVFVAYFDVSHDSLTLVDTSQRGLTLIGDTMRANGVITRSTAISVLAAEGEAIPEDAAALILPRPITQYTEDEVAVIDAYLNSGGGLIVLADALFNDEPFMAEGTPLSRYLFENYGVRALDAVAVDAASNLSTPLDIIGFAIFEEMPIGQNIPPGANTLFRVARVMEASPNKPATVANGRIIITSAESHAERNLRGVAETNTYSFEPDEDTLGPVDLVVWAFDEGGDGSRVVLIGDGDFIQNGIIQAGAVGNAALFLESVSWVTGFDDAIEFGSAANPSALPVLFVGGRQLDVIGLFVIGLMPATVLLAGFGIWYRRSRR